MTFATDETSIQDGSPIELYKFTGTYNTYRITNRGQDVVNADGTYVSDSIRRGQASAGTQEDDDINMDVEIRASHPMVTEYAINEPPPSLRLEVFRVHPGDLNSTLTIWDGEVISWNIKGRIAKLRVPSLFSFLFDGPLPGVKYQAPCNHVLGDVRCGVDMTSVANSYDTTVVSITANVIEVFDNPFEDGECDAGEMIYAVGGERKMITQNTQETFTLATSFSGLTVGDTVTLRRGCDHALNGDCVNRFSNSINFGGFPFVPNRNPYGGRL
jgi:uncharacterized phage protein (TIGR02218 family)